MNGAEPEASLLNALQHHRAGRTAAAATLYGRVLEQHPDHPNALLLLALIHADGPDFDEAEALFGRYLALCPGDALALHHLGNLRQRRGDDTAAVALLMQAAAAKPDFAPTHNDLGVSLQRLAQQEAALAAFERAVALDPAYAAAQCNRGLLLQTLGRIEEAQAAFRDVVAIPPRSAGGWHDYGLAAGHLDALAEAEAAFGRAIALDPAHSASYLELARLFEHAHRGAEAEEQRVAWARRQPIAVRACVGPRPEARILLLGAAGLCNIATDFLFSARRFETIAVHLLPGEAPPAGLPPADLVFNAVADADRGAAFLAPVAALGAKLGLPLLNPPARIPLTRRDRVPALLADIPHLVVPPVARLDRAALAAIAAAETPLPQPMLVRPAGAHGGDDLLRVEASAELGPYLAGLPCEDFYWSPFCDYRSADGWFRKYRLIFVDREIYPYHLAIARNWLVHYWRADMREAEWMKREEEAFLADWTRIFSPSQAAAIRAVAQCLDLDYAGIDCALTEDGQVLLFEANASMLVHLHDSRAAFPYKHAYVPRIFEAMAELVARRIAAAEVTPLRRAGGARG